MMATYRLSDAEIQKRIDRRLFVKAMVIAAVFILTFYFAVFRVLGLRLILLAAFGGVYWLYLEWVAAQTRMRQVERAREYKIVLGNDQISWYRYRKRAKMLQKSEVRKIEETDKGLILSPRTLSRRKIVVPRLIEDYETLKLKLGEWRTITQRKPQNYFLITIQMAIFSAILGGMFAYGNTNASSTASLVAMILSGLGFVSAAFSFVTLLFGVNNAVHEEEEGGTMLLMMVLIAVNGAIFAFEMFFR